MYSGYSAPLAALTGTLLCFPVAWFGPVITYVLPILIVLPLVLPWMPTLIPSVFGLPPLARGGVVHGADHALVVVGARQDRAAEQASWRPIVSTH